MLKNPSRSRKEQKQEDQEVPAVILVRNDSVLDRMVGGGVVDRGIYLERQKQQLVEFITGKSDLIGIREDFLLFIALFDFITLKLNYTF